MGHPAGPAAEKFKYWKRDNDGWNEKKILVGVTDASWDEIVMTSLIIWIEHFRGEYAATGKNCQNFAYLLYERIGLPDEEIIDSKRTSFKEFPGRLSSTRKELTVPILAATLLAEMAIFPSVFSPMALGVVGLACALRKNQDKTYLKNCDKWDLPEFLEKNNTLTALRRALCIEKKKMRRQGSRFQPQKLAGRQLDGPYIKNLLAIIDRFRDSLDEVESDTESEFEGYTSGEDYVKDDIEEKSFTSVVGYERTPAPSEYGRQYESKGTVYLPPAQNPKNDPYANTSYGLTAQDFLDRGAPTMHARGNPMRTWSDPTGHTTSLSTLPSRPKPPRQWNAPDLEANEHSHVNRYTNKTFLIESPHTQRLRNLSHEVGTSTVVGSAKDIVVKESFPVWSKWVWDSDRKQWRRWRWNSDYQDNCEYEWRDPDRPTSYSSTIRDDWNGLERGERGHRRSDKPSKSPGTISKGKGKGKGKGKYHSRR